eukprot:CAMPEP_0202379856 /NCGR_PEP_ID=MMETSP1127-20130417/25877_1 /ASSEMBLY_ACC=CAM_ASM_000462 /TAXON_ID=3047 /ORGANISM="Dunaliella tertiolecta, Strain CCMP1320" /LENGTH=161 /DNA_ID=CAMNT_0048978439 /DNA_START=445 /DNA_END=931 /DNA_ORIENTATION=+
MSLAQSVPTLLSSFHRCAGGDTCRGGLPKDKSCRAPNPSADAYTAAPLRGANCFEGGSGWDLEVLPIHTLPPLVYPAGRVGCCEPVGACAGLPARLRVGGGHSGDAAGQGCCCPDPGGTLVAARCRAVHVRMQQAERWGGGVQSEQGELLQLQHGCSLYGA